MSPLYLVCQIIDGKIDVVETTWTKPIAVQLTLDNPSYFLLEVEAV